MFIKAILSLIFHLFKIEYFITLKIIKFLIRRMWEMESIPISGLIIGILLVLYIYKHFFGNLLTSFGPTIVDCIAKCVSSVSLRWPQARRMTHEVRWLTAATPMSFISLINSEEQLVWTANAFGNFSVKSAMQVMRNKGQSMQWHRLVWGKNHVPCFVFILWLLCKKRPSIMDRVKKWGVPMTAKRCVYC